MKARGGGGSLVRSSTNLWKYPGGPWLVVQSPLVSCSASSLPLPLAARIATKLSSSPIFISQPSLPLPRFYASARAKRRTRELPALEQTKGENSISNVKEVDATKPEIAGPRRHILIAGAGPTGLTLALCCRRKGISFDIIDSESNLSRFAGNFALLPPNAMRIYKELGISSALEEDGARINASMWTNHKGTPFFSVNHDRIVPDIPSIAVSHVHLLENLLVSLTEAGGPYTNLAPVMQTQTYSIRPAPAPIPTATTGTSGATSEAPGQQWRVSLSDAMPPVRQYDLVVVTDQTNARSMPWVQKGLLGEANVKVKNQCDHSIWRALTTRPFGLVNDRHIEMWGLDASAGMAPIGKHMLAYWASKSEEAAPYMKPTVKPITDFPDPVQFHKAFSTSTIISELPESADQCLVTFPKDLRLKSWGETSTSPAGGAGGTLLIGHAAYEMAPYPLQETALPIEDAAALAHYLSLPGISTEEAVNRFVGNRRARVEKVQDLAWKTYQRAHPNSRLRFFIRNFRVKLGSMLIKNSEKKNLAYVVNT
jgi:2-polyprenyl-6-methoxyphenol hydroxylase-like FAD-dependent oxidoreductase